MADKVVYTCGGYGSTVSVVRRPNSPNLYVRWWNGRAFARKSLGHADLEAGKGAAREVSAGLLVATKEKVTGEVTIEGLFRRYTEEGPDKGRSARDSDGRSRDVWTAFFRQEEMADPMAITRAMLDRFVGLRRAGKLEVPGRDLRPCRARPVEMDIQYLRKVYSWGAAMGGPLERNPMVRYDNEAIHEPSVARPKATSEYYRTIRRVADKVDRQKLYLPFIGLVESLGWRVSAVRQLWASDLDLRSYSRSPYGRIWKRGEVDKEGVELWTPMSRHTRAAVNLLLSRRLAVGDTWLFPAPTSKGPWSRYRARKLLQRAELLAGIEWPRGRRPRGLGYHAFRRKWRSEHRHHPDSLVARLGGWKSVKTLEIYDVVDEDDLYFVAQDRRRNRAELPRPTSGNVDANLDTHRRRMA